MTSTRNLIATAKAVLDQVEPNPFPQGNAKWVAFEEYFHNAMEANSAEWVIEAGAEFVFQGCMANAEDA